MFLPVASEDRFQSFRGLAQTCEVLEISPQRHSGFSRWRRVGCRRVGPGREKTGNYLLKPWGGTIGLLPSLRGPSHLDSGIFRVIQSVASIQAFGREKTGMTVLGVADKDAYRALKSGWLCDVRKHAPGAGIERQWMTVSCLVTRSHRRLGKEYFLAVNCKLTRLSDFC